MSATHHPYGSLDLHQGLQAVNNLTALIHRVVKKFPSDQLPPSLSPFRFHDAAPSVRISGHTGELAITMAAQFRQAPVKVPLSLLNVQESEVTQWVRQQYWQHSGARKEQEKSLAVAHLALARKKLDEAKVNLAAAQQKVALYYPDPKTVRVDTRSEAEKAATRKPKESDTPS